MIATRNGHPSTNGTALPILAPETRVKAADRDNFGTVILDNGKTTRVHFESPDGYTADVDLPRKDLTVVGGVIRERPRVGTPRPHAPAATPEADGIDDRTAWVLRRLMIGMPVVTEEMQGIAEPFRELADDLAAVPPEARQDAFDAMLDGHPDKDGVVMAVAAADPAGPQPPPPQGPPDPYTAWTASRLMIGERFDMESLQNVPEPFWPLIEGLHVARGIERHRILADFLEGRPDADTFNRAVLLADPLGPAPAIWAAEQGEEDWACATLADIRRLVSDDQWAWKGWLAVGVLNALAADPGTGKTIMAADLARRLWLGLPWPDDQPNSLPEGTRTLWVPGDRHYTQLIGLAEKFGLPDEAILFNAPSSDPASGLDLDDPAELAALAGRIEAERPGLVFVDTVGQTTSKNLCRPEDARDYFGPLMDLALSTRIPFLLLTHLSKDGNALGRRITGTCRLVWKMTDPDPDGQPNRRRVWVDKSYAERPPALGMTIAESGCDYDFNPPDRPEAAKGGRPSEERDKAKAFVRDALTLDNDRIGNDLAAEWKAAGGSYKTFWRAVDDMEEAGELTKDGGPGTRKQTVLHLIRTEPEAAPDSPS